jgi:hypothetical protein
MNRMTDEQWEWIKLLLRSYGKLQIDATIMTGLLFQSQLDKVPPKDWRADLERLRKLPAHRNTLAELESSLERADRNRLESEHKVSLERSA